ncbi:inorganic phosphate transporter [Sediminibacterium sp.]|uniref:inorganic phosphate transporter n=1 Tax=Sediminibacterium sp. TaxID=1917865 RepID=UPI00271E4044|nr:inorganic phosphate transporter [Sediminibacterium sp.]MDO9156084.1 inorganic phosphate transporter [Sediminibacterium sp.]MDP1974172.1 inorganic phosphate transporter [Sediminibacterium sp.]MDP2422517.1 inorganic phosphate transporter [Sediminibacterium sp.]
MFTLLVIIIVLAFIFDYINGFHDAANSIATIVSTKVLTPFQAVAWAAFFNFTAFFISKYIFKEFGIGNTVAKWVNAEFITLEVLMAGIMAAITWNLITWWFGIPSSSSHTLMGGFIGAALAHAGGLSSAAGDVINYAKVVPTFLFIFFAPLIGMFIAFVITIIIVHLCKRSNPYKAENWFKKLQLVSSAAFSIGHGGNDAQKVMGIIGAAIIFYEKNTHGVNMDFNTFVDAYPWVPFTSFLCIGIGTMSGGWKIVKTMGTKITKVTPLEGVAAETAGAITLFMTEHFKIPVSTTHTITGAIIGVGATKRLSAVRWGVTVNLLWAWILTIPISAFIAAIFYAIIKLIV